MSDVGFYIGALLTWYSDQMVSVLWNDRQSSKFVVSNGVRQGGVLSPNFLTVYVDDLLEKLEENGVGCFWSMYYADDIVLFVPYLVPFVKCLAHAPLLSVSSLFNANKTQLINRYSMASTCTPVLFFKTLELKLNRSVTHLGYILMQDPSDNEDITSCPSCCDPFTKTELFLSFCSSLCGCVLRSSSICFSNAPSRGHIQQHPMEDLVTHRYSHTRILHLVAGL